jgi:anti-anti-sigma factor
MWESDLAPFGVELTFGDEGARIALSGQVDVATGAALVDAATSAVARYPLVQIDLGAVTSIDSNGLRALVKVKRFADAYGVLLAVTDVGGAVEDALVTSGVGVELGLTRLDL